MRSVSEAIKHADALLPGAAAPDGEIDPRWQAIIAVGEFIDSEPDAVWNFVAKWGVLPDPDLQSAVATCLLEHLLERHFERMFSRMAELARANSNFAKTVSLCWRYGQADEQANIARLHNLLLELKSHAG